MATENDTDSSKNRVDWNKVGNCARDARLIRMIIAI